MLASAAACTAAPAVLPQGGAPAPCVFEGTGAEDTARASGPVLGRFWIRETDSDEIAWVDPLTLRRRSAYRAAVPEQTGLWAASPSGRLVAVGLRHEIRIVETETLTSVATVPTNRGPLALAWLSDDLLAGLVVGEAVLWDGTGRQVRHQGSSPSVPGAPGTASGLLRARLAMRCPGSGSFCSLVQLASGTVPPVLPRISAREPEPTAGGEGAVAFEACSRRTSGSPRPLLLSSRS